MVSQDLEVGQFGRSLFSKDFAEIVERFEGFIIQTFMNFLKDVAKLQVEYGGVKLEPNKILKLKSIHALKRSPLMYLIAEHNFKMILNSLQQIIEIHIQVLKLALPNLDIEIFLRVAIQVPPDSKASLSIAKNNIEETNNTIPLTFGLALRSFLLLQSDYVLDIEAEIILHTSCDYILPNASPEPGLSHPRVNHTDVPHIEP